MLMPYNRAPASLGRIAALAFPALFVLAAEPLYVLVDTAVVGHLGGIHLAALAIGAGVMTVAAWLGVVFAYGTTARAARRFGAGDRRAAVAEGVQGSWLALAVGLAIALLAQVVAEPLTRAMARGDSEVAEAAASWLRVAAFGAPGLLLATAGNGWLRGVQDTRRPLVIVVGTSAMSAVLCPLLVYAVGLGLVGSAAANAFSQTVAGALFVRTLVTERVPLGPDPAVLRLQLVLGRDLLVRGAALQGAFVTATVVAVGFGPTAVAGHQIAIQLWMLCALTQDAVAIAAQALIGAELGAGRVDGARVLVRRVAGVGLVTGVGFAVLIGVGAGVLPGWFSGDPAVHEQAMLAWPWFVATQPAAGLVFALDGVLLGAGDVRYLRNVTMIASLGGFLPGVLIADWLAIGLTGVWAALTLFILIRLTALLWRVRSGTWLTSPRPKSTEFS